MYIHNVESGIHNVDNTIHNVAPPKKEKVQNIASDIMNGDIMNGDIVDTPRTKPGLCKYAAVVLNQVMLL